MQISTFSDYRGSINDMILDVVLGRLLCMLVITFSDYRSSIVDIVPAGLVYMYSHYTVYKFMFKCFFR
jgi:hypothetical protein